MLAIAMFVGVGTALELAIAGHWESPPQILPFVLCAAGAATAGVAIFDPSGHIRGRRIVAGVILVGAVFGIWEHIEHNAEFEAEIRPTADLLTVWTAAIFGGNPILAPGLMAAMGLLLGASTLDQERDG